MKSKIFQLFKQPLKKLPDVNIREFVSKVCEIKGMRVMLPILIN